jgi:hypothetical protein
VADKKKIPSPPTALSYMMTRRTAGRTSTDSQ